jgi:hypothetical protein
MEDDYLKDLPLLHYKRAEKKEHASVRNPYIPLTRDPSDEDQLDKKKDESSGQ